MYEYKIDKKIEELDPIPSSWSESAKKNFIDNGEIPMAGPNPQPGAITTKKVTIAQLYDNMSSKDSVLVARSVSDLQQTGRFIVQSVRNAGPDISVQAGYIIIAPGWYRYTAHAVLHYTGTPRGIYDTVVISSNFHDQTERYNMDFSYSHDEAVTLSGVINNTTDNAQFYVSATYPDGITDLSATLKSVEIESVRRNDAVSG